MRSCDALFPRLYTDITGCAAAYREYVSHLAGPWPGLAYLDLYLNDPVYLERKFIPITIVEFKTQQSEPSIRAFSTLKDVLTRLDDEDSQKLIILEDPTPNMMAELGGKLKIDPQFWADFLVGPGWFGTGRISIGDGEPEILYRDDSLLEQLWPLPTDSSRQQHVCFRFIAHREERITETNCKQGLLSTKYPITDNARAGPPQCARSIPLRKNLTIWENHGSGHNMHNEASSAYSSCIGVVAIQSQNSEISEEVNQSSYVFRESISKPSFDTKTDKSDFYITGEWEGRPQKAMRSNNSIREIYSRHLRFSFKDKDFFTAFSKDPGILFIDIYRLIARFWVTEIESQHLFLSWVERYYHRETIIRKTKFLLLDSLLPNPYGGLPEKLEVDLVGLQGRYMDIGPCRHLISEVGQHCIARKKRCGEGLAEPTMIYDELIGDFDCLENCMSRLEQRSIRIIEFLKSIRADFETERSRYRNRLLSILSLWAWLVSPISILTSILGLGTETESDSTKVGDIKSFWIALIPVLIGVIVIITIILTTAECFDRRARRSRS